MSEKRYSRVRSFAWACLVAILSITPLSNAESEQPANEQIQELHVAPQSPSRLLKIERDGKASGLTDASLNALWLDDSGNQGWAVGDDGEVLHYTREDGWRRDERASGLTDETLRALWLDGSGNEGWAIGGGRAGTLTGDGGEILRYSRGDGWRRDERASAVTRLPLNALWLDDSGSQGWAVGTGGQVLRYGREDGWRRDEEASGQTDETLRALWLDDSGNEGWAVGGGGL